MGEDQSADHTTEQSDDTGTPDTGTSRTDGVVDAEISTLQTQVAKLEAQLDERTRQQGGEVRKNQTLSEQMTALRDEVAELTESLGSQKLEVQRATNRATSIKRFTEAGLPTDGVDFDLLSGGTAKESESATEAQIEYGLKLLGSAADNRRKSDLMKSARTPEPGGGGQHNGNMSFEQFSELSRADAQAYMNAHPAEYQELVVARVKAKAKEGVASVS